MKYLQKRRYVLRTGARMSGSSSDDDPLSGVANLFDLGLVFIVGLIVTLFSAYHLQDLFSEQSTMTITKKNPAGQMEVIIKQGRKIKALRISQSERAKGRGTRLGVAYQLEDGSMVYVPDAPSANPSEPALETEEKAP